MAEPTEAEIFAVIDQMTGDRGWVINSFSQIECRLADLILQCAAFPEYAELAGLPLPMGSGNRVSRVRELMTFGPLADHADELEKMLARFMEFEELRHMMTHGFAAFHFTPDGDMGMIFTRYVPPKKGAQVTQERLFYRPQTMRDQRESSVAFVSEAMKILRKTYEAVGLDPDKLAQLEG